MDPELTAYLDRHFDAVNQQIEGLRQETTQQIEGLRQETTQQIEGLRQETNQRFDKVEDRFDKLEDALHLMGVRIEGIESTIELLPEGQRSIREMMEKDKAELIRRVDEVRRDLKLYANHVNGRFDRVDARLDLFNELEARVTRLEQRLAS